MVADLMIFWCGSIHKQKLRNKETQFILVNHNMVLSSPKMMMRMILIELWVLKQIKWIKLLVLTRDKTNNKQLRLQKKRKLQDWQK